VHLSPTATCRRRRSSELAHALLLFCSHVSCTAVLRLQVRETPMPEQYRSMQVCTASKVQLWQYQWLPTQLQQLHSMQDFSTPLLLTTQFLIHSMPLF
jgi:ABC-type phosphate/phosphonate transport system permease subunit